MVGKRNDFISERLLEIIEKYRIPLVNCPFLWATQPDLTEVEQKLIENPDVKVVAMVIP